MRFFFLWLCCLGGCTTVHLFDSSLSISKQKQKIAVLQKKLELRERSLSAIQEEVLDLQAELHQLQLAIIVKQMANYEQQLQKDSRPPRSSEEKETLFLKERELLQQILEKGPSPEALEAQGVLDQILRWITEIKNYPDR